MYMRVMYGIDEEDMNVWRIISINKSLYAF